MIDFMSIIKKHLKTNSISFADLGLLFLINILFSKCDFADVLRFFLHILHIRSCEKGMIHATN